MAESSVIPGSKVRVNGLAKAAQFNGLEGTVRHSEEAAAAGRLCVALDGGRELSLKAENVEVLVQKPSSDGVTGTFDWIVDYNQIKEYLTCEHLGIERSARILQVGCGTSELSEKVYDSGFANITNVDIDAPTIEVSRKTARRAWSLRAC